MCFPRNFYENVFECVMHKENNIGKMIRELRISSGYTQEQLAEKIGIDNKHLSKIEKGVHIPSYKTMQKLSSVFGLKLNFFENETETTSQNPIYTKSLKILNSSNTEEEQKYYFEVLKLAQKGLHISKND